jgi:hypothetical protein
VLEAVKVRVLVPVVDAGLKLAVTPAGKPLAARATVPVKQLLDATVIVLLPVAPWATVRLAGLADSEKSGCWAAVTVSAIVVVWVRFPLVPVTVTLAVPTTAELEAVKVTVLLPVVDAGLKLAVTPAGKPLALRATLPVNPPNGATLTVLLPLPH